MGQLEKAGIPGDVAEHLEEVCALPKEQLRQRADWIRETLRPQVTRQERFEGGMAFEFEASPELRERLEELIVLERECCGPLSFELHESAGLLRLEVREPEKSGSCS